MSNHSTDDSDGLARIQTMLNKEHTTYLQQDYLARSFPPSSYGRRRSLPVDAFCRNTMAKWCASLCKFCQYDVQCITESVFSCVDRFVATPQGFPMLQDRDRYQLVVMAAFYTLAKMHEAHPLDPVTFVALSKGKFTQDDLVEMESAILEALAWRIHPPTPTLYVHEILRDGLLPSSQEDDDDHDDEDSIATAESATQRPIHDRILELVHCQLEEAIGDYQLGCRTSPSLVAFAALSNALEGLEIDAHQNCSTDRLDDILRLLPLSEDDRVSLEDIKTALLRVVLRRVVASTEASDNHTSSPEDESWISNSLLLLQQCHDFREKRSKQVESESTQGLRISSPVSCVPHSPRTVVEGRALLRLFIQCFY